MAKLISAAAALFLLFAFSQARTPSDLPNGLDAIPDDDDNNIPITDADAKSTIATNTLRLPSERSGSETVLESDPEAVGTVEQKLPEAEFGTIISSEENTVDGSKSETLPLTVISFRPVGRHFPRRPFPSGFRHGHRCRHGHRQGKWTPRVRPGNENEKDTYTPYGDDMILSTGDDMKFDRPFRGRARQIPSRWTNFRHVGPRFPVKHDDEMDSERPHRHHRRHRHHDHDHDFGMQNEGEEHHKEHKHDHGLFKSFRKFLNGF